MGRRETDSRNRRPVLPVLSPLANLAQSCLAPNDWSPSVDYRAIIRHDRSYRGALSWFFLRKLHPEFTFPRYVEVHHCAAKIKYWRERFASANELGKVAFIFVHFRLN